MRVGRVNRSISIKHLGEAECTKRASNLAFEHVSVLKQWLGETHGREKTKRTKGFNGWGALYA